MITQLFLALDNWLILPFRWFDSAELGLMFGILMLALQSVILGHAFMALMSTSQRAVRVKHETEAAKRSALAIQALQYQDKNAYLAQNTLAKDAYGHSMALAVGRVTASLCPAVGALAWLDLRFGGVPLDLPFPIPGLGGTVLYPFYFIPAYFLMRFLWSYGWKTFRMRRGPASPAAFKS